MDIGESYIIGCATRSESWPDPGCIYIMTRHSFISHIMRVRRVNNFLPTLLININPTY
jgi:hypothetical protein